MLPNPSAFTLLGGGGGGGGGGVADFTDLLRFLVGIAVVLRFGGGGGGGGGIFRGNREGMFVIVGCFPPRIFSAEKRTSFRAIIFGKGLDPSTLILFLKSSKIVFEYRYI